MSILARVARGSPRGPPEVRFGFKFVLAVYCVVCNMLRQTGLSLASGEFVLIRTHWHASTELQVRNVLVHMLRLREREITSRVAIGVSKQRTRAYSEIVPAQRCEMLLENEVQRDTD